MAYIKFSRLPGNLRVKLSEKGQQELWHRVNELGGVKALADASGYSQSKIYNWKSKDLAIPKNFVQQIMGENNTKHIVLLKGPESGGSVKNPELPLLITDELLTRIDLSVTENIEGTPVYITSEKSLQQRFIQLLKHLGQVQYTVYTRKSRYEVRYPKFLQSIFSGMEFSQELGALVDENGVINGDKIVLPDREISIDAFDKRIFSRAKRFNLALYKKDSDRITEMIAEESDRVKGLIDNQR